MRLIVTAGGTGGHILPALSLIQALSEKVKALSTGPGSTSLRIGEIDPDVTSGVLSVLFISTGRDLDRRILGDINCRWVTVALNPPPHRPSFRWITFLSALISQTIKVYPVVKGFKPDAVIGFGGYATLPALLAASLRRVPIILHEQNARPGLANRLLSRLAKSVAVSFPETLLCFRKDKASLTGNPIRREIIETTVDEGFQRFPSQDGEFRLLVMGGSQGSERINEALLKALPEVIREHPRLNIIHITGDRMAAAIRRHYKEIGVRYWVFPFLKEMGLAYKSSDLIIGRAGATSIAEVAALGKPTILIPHPLSSSGQMENAKIMIERKAAIVIEEDKLTPQHLKESIVLLIKDRGLLSEIARNVKSLGRPDGAECLADEVMEVAGV